MKYLGNKGIKKIINLIDELLSKHYNRSMKMNSNILIMSSIQVTFDSSGYANFTIGGFNGTTFPKLIDDNYEVSIITSPCKTPHASINHDDMLFLNIRNANVSGGEVKVQTNGIWLSDGTWCSSISNIWFKYIMMLNRI